MGFAVDSHAVGTVIPTAAAAGIAPAAIPAAAAARLLGVSRSKFFQLHSSGRVPAPVYLSARCPGWVRSELLDWLAAGCPDRQTWAKLSKPGKAVARG